MEKENIVFKKPKGLDNVVNALSKFDEQLAFKVNSDGTMTTNKVSTSYKISASIQLDKEFLNVPETGFNLGIINVPKFIKTLNIFNNEEVYFYVRKAELGILKLFIVEDKKVASIPISDLIKSDDAGIKNRDTLFEIEVDKDILSFINKASKISNILVMQLAIKQNGTVDVIIGDIKEGSEYLLSYTIKDDVKDYETLRQSKISKLFFSHKDYDIVIRYNLVDVIKAFNGENLSLALLKNGAMLITEKQEDYIIEYGFIPIA